MTDEVVPADATDPNEHLLNPELRQMVEQMQGVISIQEFRGPLMPGQEFQRYMQAWSQAGEKIFELSENISARTHRERMDDNRTARFVFGSFTVLGLGYLVIAGVVVVVLLATDRPTEGVITALVAGAIGVAREALAFGRIRRNNKSRGDNGE